MQLPRASSIHHLVLLALTVVTLPLVAAIVTAVLWVDDLAEQSREAVIAAQVTTRAGRSLVENVTVMERSARQYLVLGEPALHQAYLDARAELRRLIEQIEWLGEPDEDTMLALAELAHEEAELFAVLHNAQPEAAAAAALAPRFAALSGKARQVFDLGSRQIWSEAGTLPDRASRVNHVLLWLAGASILATMALGVLFAVLINRPLRRIDASIRRLGAGDLEQPVTAGSGPHDLTELADRLEWLRLRLVELEAQKVSFLRHISHELKTPLTTVREGVALLTERGAGAAPLAEQAEIAAIVDRESVKLQKLIEDLLRVGAMRSARSYAPVRWDEIISAVVDDHGAAIGARRLTVESRLEAVRVHGDGEELRVVADNLLSNAIKYSPDGARIRIHLRVVGGEAILDVSDSGPGIPEPERQRIFEPFFQGRHKPRGSVKGTGLGLAIANEYVDAHDGRIESVDAAIGAHMRVSIPIGSPADEGAATGRHAGVDGRRGDAG